jgi:hypothetical protein
VANCYVVDLQRRPGGATVGDGAVIAREGFRSNKPRTSNPASSGSINRSTQRLLALSAEFQTVQRCRNQAVLRGDYAGMASTVRREHEIIHEQGAILDDRFARIEATMLGVRRTKRRR